MIVCNPSIFAWVRSLTALASVAGRSRNSGKEWGDPPKPPLICSWLCVNPSFSLSIGPNPVLILTIIDIPPYLHTSGYGY
ncbi:MAG: hypothetical protein CM1200mP3_04480 [Chloroflexota bacterium]|nr:MAG: hypothetical protein CM1200mP3_04480 [Chloroflexota bacterium]